MSLFLTAIVAFILGYTGSMQANEAPVEAPIQAPVEVVITAPTEVLAYEAPTVATTSAPKPVVQAPAQPIIAAPVQAVVQAPVQAPIQPTAAPVVPTVAPVAPYVAPQAPAAPVVAPTQASKADMWAAATLRDARISAPNVKWLFTNEANCGAALSAENSGGCTYETAANQYTVIISPELAGTAGGHHILFHELAHTQGIADECAAEAFAHQFESEALWSYPECQK